MSREREIVDSLPESDPTQRENLLFLSKLHSAITYAEWLCSLLEGHSLLKGEGFGGKGLWGAFEKTHPPTPPCFFLLICRDRLNRLILEQPIREVLGVAHTLENDRGPGSPTSS